MFREVNRAQKGTLIPIKFNAEKTLTTEQNATIAWKDDEAYKFYFIFIIIHIKTEKK